MYGVAGILIVLLAFFLGRRQATEVTFMRGLKKGFHPQGRHRDAVGGSGRMTMRIGLGMRMRLRMRTRGTASSTATAAGCVLMDFVALFIWHHAESLNFLRPSAGLRSVPRYFSLK